VGIKDVDRIFGEHGQGTMVSERAYRQQGAIKRREDVAVTSGFRQLWEREVADMRGSTFAAVRKRDSDGLMAGGADVVDAVCILHGHVVA
jgi:hypothetical protein